MENEISVSEFAGTAREVLRDLLSQLELCADIDIETGTSISNEEGDTCLPTVLAITGEDLGILIGRRGQTLAAMQYIVRLIATQRLGGSVPLVLDVNGYKQRRYESLRTLAQHVAEQVAVNRRSFALEPMPAYERRIIHLALADHQSVVTQSSGFGDARKVVVFPRDNTRS